MRFTSRNRHLLFTPATCEQIIRSPYIRCVQVLVVVLETYFDRATEQMISKEENVCEFIWRVMCRAKCLESFA